VPRTCRRSHVAAPSVGRRRSRPAKQHARTSAQNESSLIRITREAYTDASGVLRGTVRGDDCREVVRVHPRFSGPVDAAACAQDECRYGDHPSRQYGATRGARSKLVHLVGPVGEAQRSQVRIAVARRICEDATAT